jgi:hypothetical protein
MVCLFYIFGVALYGRAVFWSDLGYGLDEPV